MAVVQQEGLFGFGSDMVDIQLTDHEIYLGADMAESVSQTRLVPIVSDLLAVMVHAVVAIAASEVEVGVHGFEEGPEPSNVHGCIQRDPSRGDGAVGDAVLPLVDLRITCKK